MRPLLLLPLLLPSCASTPALDHIVLFDLKDPADAPAILADSRRLADIPGVTHVTTGTHLDTGRANTIADYDAAVIISLNSTDAYHAYADHPIHKDLVGKWRERWDSIRVIDVARDAD